MREQEQAFNALRGAGVFVERSEVVVVAVFPRAPSAAEPLPYDGAAGYTCLYRAAYKQAPIQAVDVDRAAGAALRDYLEARRVLEEAPSDGGVKTWEKKESEPMWRSEDYAQD